MTLEYLIFIDILFINWNGMYYYVRLTVIRKYHNINVSLYLLIRLDYSLD